MPESHPLTELCRVTCGPTQLAVLEAGRGEPIVLLHGIGSRAVSWLPILPALADRYRLVAPDLRGHGASDKPASGYLVRDYAADLNGLVTAYDLMHPTIIGHSLGGLITLYWASRNPDRAARLVLEDVPLRSDPSAARAFEGWIALSSMSVEDAAAYYAREHPSWNPEECRRRAESITATHPAVFTELRDRALQPDSSSWWTSIRSIKSPVLLVHGDVESGGRVSVEDATRFGEVVPFAEVVRIPGGGHSLHRDTTDAYLAAVLSFLDRTS